jgi:hypothetical protein
LWWPFGWNNCWQYNGYRYVNVCGPNFFGFY